MLYCVSPSFSCYTYCSAVLHLSMGLSVALIHCNAVVGLALLLALKRDDEEADALL